MQLATLALLALTAGATAAGDHSTMAYMYCQNATMCAGETKEALALAENITYMVVGSNMCRISEFNEKVAQTWCNYEDYAESIKQVQDAGIKVILNAAGPKNISTNPFYTTDMGTDRLVAIADKLGAIGWAFDLETHRMSLDDYKGLFTKCRTAFEPKGYKIQYTSGRAFGPTEDYAELLPIVDWVFDMAGYGGDIGKFEQQWATVPEQYRHKYIPGSSVAKWTSDIATAFLNEVKSVDGLQTVGYFAIGFQGVTTPQFMWNYLGAWLQA